MEKTLKNIQTAAKVGRILCQIVEVMTVVGAIISFLGALLFAFGAITAQRYADFNIFAELNGQGLSAGDVYGNLVGAIIICVTQAYLASYGCAFFKHEEAEGEPFSFALADECKGFALRLIVVPLAAAIVAEVAFGIVSGILGGSGSFNADIDVDLGMGLVFLILSFILRYGAYVKEGREN